jgi:hypothetical protein
MPNHYIGDLLPTIGMSGLSRVRTELLQLAVVIALAPHPVQMNRQFPSHRHLGDLPPAPHGKVEELAAPLGLAAHRDLRRGKLCSRRLGLFLRRRPRSVRCRSESGIGLFAPPPQNLRYTLTTQPFVLDCNNTAPRFSVNALAPSNPTAPATGTLPFAEMVVGSAPIPRP